MTTFHGDGQVMVGMEPRPRVADEDRDKAVHRIQQAFADGRLGAGELNDRLERALMAVSDDDLLSAVADLSDSTDEVVRITATGGRIRRAGDWQVPRRLRVESDYGGVRLDLSRAVIPHLEIDIELRLAYGSATIILPPGATANADGARTQWGSVNCKAAGRPRPGTLHVRVTGEFGYGRLNIRNSRR